MTGLTGAGFIPEYMSGERAQALPAAVPHQLFSSSAVINPMISGMLGLDGDALRRTLVVAPHIPQSWTVEFDQYRVGGSTISGTIASKQGETRSSLKISGDPLQVTISPAFAAGAELVEAKLNGARVTDAALEPSPSDTHVTLRTKANVGEIEATIKVKEAAEPLPVLNKPSPGASAQHRN
jgi:hypothetical protein